MYYFLSFGTHHLTLIGQADGLVFVPSHLGHSVPVEELQATKFVPVLVCTAKLHYMLAHTRNEFHIAGGIYIDLFNLCVPELIVVDVPDQGQQLALDISTLHVSGSQTKPLLSQVGTHEIAVVGHIVLVTIGLDNVQDGLARHHIDAKDARRGEMAGSLTDIGVGSHQTVETAQADIGKAHPLGRDMFPSQQGMHIVLGHNAST